MKKTIKSLDSLRDSRILFDKELPAFGYLLVLIVGVFLCMAVVWSMKTPKMYTIQAQGVVTNTEANYVMCTYTGEITNCKMTEGDLVEKGDILFSIKMQQGNFIVQEDVEKEVVTDFVEEDEDGVMSYT